MSDAVIRIQQTPNPNAMLFHVDRTVTEERMKQFDRADQAANEPLAKALFEIEGVDTVFFMPNSITVNKKTGAAWDTITATVEGAIRDHFAA